MQTFHSTVRIGTTTRLNLKEILDVLPQTFLFRGRDVDNKIGIARPVLMIVIIVSDAAAAFIAAATLPRLSQD
jgi:hypothetical protein